ncbi:GFA family protein [Pseudorhodobacter sp. MZDSW-24AT]|uniref:GFA family protein n=1 Tax=Pseudorhodobacter sp. MZDSW-24AT TaxID=2052957 RepID=UPI000C1E170D|nr:GFA family protein [Pseudorhodobacter sp. MZDSW-24AT]PJF09187.1 aldehyde-activating protein [Pseudorhodobacter sp. MZDSW-24AT]
MHTGSCQCGAVRFTVASRLPPPNACHCTICRKQSGHVFASTEVKKADLTISGAAEIRWYASSAKVRRGFCGTCGSSLFWDPPQHDWIAVAMGAFDGPTGTQMHLHIFVADKGDYYEIGDGLPQNAQ